jgi:sugar phosphate isomerase/epimerase
LKSAGLFVKLTSENHETPTRGAAMKPISRRQFLQQAALAAGVVASDRIARAADARVEPATSRGPGVRFAVRCPFKTGDLRERALLLHRLGYDGIELGHEYIGRPVSSILSDLKGTGIVVSAIVGSIQLLDPDPAVRAKAVELDRKRLEMARALGAVGVIEVPTFGACRFPDVAGTPGPHAVEDRLLIGALKQLAPDVQRTGVKILLEPLTKKETHYMNLQGHGARIIEQSGGQCARLLSDFYHMQMEEQDIAATLTRYGKYTGYVHLADGVKRTEPGSLPFDYRPGFRALKKAGYRGWLTVESGASDDPDLALERALKYVRRQWHDA